MRLISLATIGSICLLLGAFAFQHWGGLAPCKMCLWQRWPHGAAILIGFTALFIQSHRLAALGAVSVLITGGIGVYHVGVEQKWWEGPSTCTSSSNAGLSVDELLDKILAAPVVRCDEIAWDLFGISMAGWNAIICLGLFVLWIGAFTRR